VDALARGIVTAAMDAHAKSFQITKSSRT